MPIETPAYFDFLIENFRRGAAGRDVHLGYWEDPPPLSAPLEPGEFERSQRRLTELVVAAADIESGGQVLDVGCGFGSLLEALARWPGLGLTGLGNDARQLEICASIARGGAELDLVKADACDLPFADGRFDRVFCIEAMFHFRSRAAFLAEAARVLKKGAKLVVTDILLALPGADAPLPAAAIADAMRIDYGPWPELWIGVNQVAAYARAAGLALEFSRDIAPETLPSYRMTAPRAWDGTPARAQAGALMRWLHEMGRLTYALMRFVKL